MNNANDSMLLCALETTIRRIVREELAALVAGEDGAVPLPLDPVAGFLRDLEPGDVAASSLYESFRAACPQAPMSPRMFAFRAMRSGLVNRRLGRGGRVYTILPKS